MFCHLHVHSEYSLLESSVKIDRLLDAVCMKGMKAVALTDKYGMSGCIEFYRQALKRAIKPILGCEICIKTDLGEKFFHLTLIAKDLDGYKNLCRIISYSHTTSNRPVPHITIPHLADMKKGLIALSGCSRGELSRIAASNRVKLNLVLERYRKIFGKDFYIEIQRYPISSIPSEDAGVSEILAGLSKKTGIPPVATNNVHYVSRKDYESYKALACLKSMSGKKDPTFKILKTGEDYLKDPFKMQELFRDIPEALSNTLKIADLCDLSLPLGQRRVPVFNIGCNKEGHEEHLRKICYQGLESRYGKDMPQNITARLEKELDMIRKTGFIDYFLIVADMAGFAYRKGIPLCGKGSAAGSLVSYCLRISNVDPVENDLYFERFLNEERKSLPDIDIDIPNEDRERIIKYAASKYGMKNIARVSTFSTTRPRASIREAARILSLAKEDIDYLVRSVPGYSRFLTQSDMARKLDESSVLEYSGSQYDDVLKLSEKIGGFVRHVSMHPSAVILSDKDFSEIIPLTLSETGELMSQYDKESIEALGIMKIDLINSLSLCLISDVSGMLAKRGVSLCLEDISYSDDRVYDMISKGDTLGVFQLESFGIRTLARKVKPQSLNDITLLISLYRPGPQQSGMVKNFIERKFSREKTTYMHKDLVPILRETFGIILYQEQVMKISLKVAGYSLSEADNLRKAMTRLSGKKMKEQESRFIGGAIKRGYSKDTAEKIFYLISKFASYGFVKAHAAAYAELSYKTCLLKTYHPAEFFSAILSNGSGYYSKMQYIEEAKRCGVGIMPPDVNKSDPFRYTVEDEGRSIRVPIISIKNLGSSVSRSIARERERGGLFKDFYDFYQRVKPKSRISSSAVTNMIKVGAFDYTGLKKRFLVLELERLSGTRSWQAYGLLPKVQDDGMDDFNRKEIIESEIEILDFCITEHPLSYFNEELSNHRIVPSSGFYSRRPSELIFAAGLVLSKRTEKTKSGKKMLFCTVEDKDGMFEVVCFPDIYEKAIKTVTMDRSILIEARLNFKDNNVSLIAKDIISLKALKRKTVEKEASALRELLLSSSYKGLWKTQER